MKVMISQVGTPYHKRMTNIHDFGVESSNVKLLGYNEVELLDYAGYPTAQRMWIHNDELQRMPDTSVEDEMRVTIQDQKREIASLKEALKAAKTSNGS